MDIHGVKFVHSIDVKEYNFLRKSVGWNELSANQAITGLKNSAYIVAATLGEQTIGMSRVVSDGGYIAYIADVVVYPEYQGYGIGKTMMKMVMQYIQENMNEGETVFVNLMAAKGREPFYSQFGFEERPNEKHGAGMTQYLKK